MLTTIFHWLVLDTITLLFNGNVGDTLHGLALAVRLFALSLIAFLLFLAYDAVRRRLHHFLIKQPPS